jgi:hypothetical protein
MRKGTHDNSYWGERIRQRIAFQVGFIRHWQIVEGEYWQAPEVQATWFVDPPYQEAGKLYRCDSSGIDYGHLAQWCRSRYGQTIVCENEGATWLSFRPFRAIKASPASRGGKVSHEVIWEGCR